MDTRDVEFGVAIGLFNGEGCTQARKGPLNSAALAVQIAQAGSPEVLERFQAAMGGRGHVNGPYRQNHEKWKPVWRYNCSKYEDSLWILEQMDPWLSEQKRAQARAAIARVQEVKARPRLPKRVKGVKRKSLKAECIRGHDLTEIPQDKNGRRFCPECRRIRSREWYERNKTRSHEKSAAWRQANPEKHRELVRASRARALLRDNATSGDNQQGRPPA